MPQYREESNRYILEHNESQDLKKAPTIKPAIEIPLNGSGMKKSEVNLVEVDESK